MNFQLLHVISQNFRSGVSAKFKRSPLNVYEIDNFRAKLQIKVANKGQSCRSANKTGLLLEKSFCNFWTSLLISWFWNVRFCILSSIFWFFPRFYFFLNKIGQFQKIWHRSIELNKLSSLHCPYLGEENGDKVQGEVRLKEVQLGKSFGGSPIEGSHLGEVI